MIFITKFSEIPVCHPKCFAEEYVMIVYPKQWATIRNSSEKPLFVYPRLPFGASNPLLPNLRSCLQ